jgi:inorganic pyrophosphatase
MEPETSFWQTIAELAATNPIVFDRPKGSAHPRYPNMIYPLDYGYLRNTISGDGACIDVWVGTLNKKTLTGILCTFDKLKGDAEIKLLIACSLKDVETIRNFNSEMQMLFIPNPLVEDDLSH